MAIGQETEGRGIGGFMQRSQRQWEQQRMIDAQEEMRRQREMQAEDAKKKESNDGGQEKKKDSGPASQNGLNRSSSSINVLGSGGATIPYERRENVGVGGSTGHVTHYDAGKAPPYLDAIADKYGINRNDFKRMAFIESGFNTSAHNPSGASGLFQFMPKTAKQFGLSNPFDGPANADAAARLWNANKASLTNSLGREPTAGELYFAHQQGAGGAASAIKNPNGSAVGTLGHKAVVQNGGSSGISNGDFVHKWTSKFDGVGAQASDGATPRNRDAGNPQSPVRVADAGTTSNDATPSRATPAASTGGATSYLTDAQVAAAVGRGEHINYDAQGRPIGTSAGTLPTSGNSPATPAATTPSTTGTPATGTGQPAGDVPLPPRRPEMGPPMPDQSTQPTQPAQQPQQQAQQQEDGLSGFFKDIGSFFSGEPIKDKSGREWDALYGFEKPPGEIAASFQQSNEAAKASDAPSMLDRSSAATATSGESKSIMSDAPDIGAAFTPALNFFSSLFG